MIDIYFTKPQQLLDIFAGMEEKSLLMIQKSQDNEEALEELQTVFAISKRKMGKEIGVLKKQTQMLEKLVSREEERAKDFTLMVLYFVRLFSFGEYNEELQDMALSEVNSQIEGVYSNVIGQNDANINTLQMTLAIENKLEDLLQTIDELPPNVVEAAEKQRERHRRQLQRELKVKQQEEMQAERLRRTMEKALLSSKKGCGRKLVSRSVPPVVKQKVEKTKWRVREDEEMVYFLTKN
uniref:Cilia- and flagella-associated protein 100 n=1 Tax=Strigamia maritima TaxID=126957 RepID=T1JAE0_STRMM